jgi:hypothetical protein
MGLTKPENDSIRAELAASENPFFLFHDDPDGLCSFILLKRFKGKGRGMMVKAEPNVNDRFVSSVRSVKPDTVFVLDVALMQQSFVNTIMGPSVGVKNIVWIDHHQPVELMRVKYFNPRLHSLEDNPPVSYLSYKISGNKNDLWLAMAGIVSDWHMPDFAPEFVREYPDLLPKMMTAEEALFTTGIGKIGRILSFMLKGPTSDAVNCIRALEKINSPYEIMNKLSKEGKFIYNKYKEISAEYDKLLSQARASVESGESRFLIFTYKSKQSFSGDLSNELLFLYPDRVIVVGREKPDSVMLSFRSRNSSVLKPLTAALKGIDGYGGGHEHACGGSVKRDHFAKFIKAFVEQFDD